MLDPKEATFLKASQQSVQKHLEHAIFLGSIIMICLYMYVYSSEIWVRIPCMLVGFVCCRFFIYRLFKMILILKSIRWLKLKSRANELALSHDINEIEKFVNQEKDV